MLWQTFLFISKKKFVMQDQRPDLQRIISATYELLRRRRRNLFATNNNNIKQEKHNVKVSL